jgi:hypothetical protein
VRDGSAPVEFDPAGNQSGMVHLPVNHRFRRPYRGLAALAGLYVLIFGIVGLIRTWGTGFFAHSDVYALGLRTNPAFAVLSILVGILVLAASAMGGNVSHVVNQVAGGVFLLAGMLMLTVLRTGANLLDFTVTTCIVSYVLGLAMLTAGLYGRVRGSYPPDSQEPIPHREHADAER